MMMNTANNNDFQANAIPNEDLNGARHATTGGDVYTELDNKDDRGMRTDLESTNAIAYGTTPDGKGPTAAPEAHNAAVAKLRNASKAAVLAVMALFGGAGMTSCEKDAVDPKPVINTLSAEDQKFADIFKPNADGSPVSIQISVGNEPFRMNNLIKMELKLIDAKYRLYEMTPIISKAPIEKAINLGAEMDPGKIEYGANIAINIQPKNGPEYSLTNTVTIIDKDDNNPSTWDPYLGQLPNQFTFDEFIKYNPNATNLKKSYIINESDVVNLMIEVITVGKKFDKTILPLSPSREAALRTGN